MTHDPPPLPEEIRRITELVRPAITPAPPAPPPRLALRTVQREADQSTIRSRLRRRQPRKGLIPAMARLLGRRTP